jgi:hypothetical protein
LKEEHGEKERHMAKASLKSEELREVRSSLNKSLRTVGEDASNLRTMLGKSLRKIDKYSTASRNGQSPIHSTTDVDTEQSNPDEEILQVNGEHSPKIGQSPKNHRRSASGSIRSRRLVGTSPEKVKHLNGTDSVIMNGHAEDQSPTRRYRRIRKSVT